MENITGRLFECLSKKGPETSLMSDFFTIGKTYLEATEDFLGDNCCDDTSFLLYSEHKTVDGFSVPMYVDAMDFEFVRIRREICLN